MNEDDFYLDENDDDDLESSYIVPSISDEDENEGSDSGDGDLEAPTKRRGSTSQTDVSLYENRLTDKELDLQRRYDEISKLLKDTDIRTTAEIILSSNPNSQSAIYIQHIIKSLFNAQAHNRMSSGLVQVGHRLNAKEVAEELGEDVVEEIDSLKSLASKQVAEFIGYLANMDTSEDSVMSIKKKQRLIPAFIIFLFYANLYSLIINCPTMPPVYQKQIDRAFDGLNKEKLKLVEDLATAYEDAGRPEVADAVRADGIHWFRKEPKEILTIKKYKDLNLDLKDVEIYKGFRTRYNNITTSITQDVISKYILVVEDEKKGILRELKDKTRAQAVDDVKRVYLDWAKQNTDNSALASQLVYGKISIKEDKD